MATAPHLVAHFWVALALLLVSAGLMRVVRNHVIRRRLLFSAALLALAGGLHLVIVGRPDSEFLRQDGARIELLVIALGLVNAFVTLLFNPWFKDQVSDRAPAIVQDAMVVVLAVVSAFVVFEWTALNLLASSAIVAAIIGFALQETLGNAFAGIAIQIEKPFRVGHWIAVAGHEGVVSEVTWRATKIRTKAGNLVVVPNSTVAKESIDNYSEPAAPTRLHIVVGCDYAAPPNTVRAALLDATRQARQVLTSPAAEILVIDFGASSINYEVRFWVDDYSREEYARDAVRTAVYYELRRRGIVIPYPIQIEYSREEEATDSSERRESFRQIIAGVPVLSKLPEDAHKALAMAASELLFADGEVIVAEGAPGSSMFVVCRGRVAITLGADRRQVAVTDAGGYFGEMSLMTGEPRTATVIARGDCTVLEIGADAFRSYVQARPEVIDQIASAATARRHELDQSRAATPSAAAVTSISLAERMRRFFGLT